jgi:transcriptional regulator with GAF, ATPase, and Fis domain
MVKTVGIRFRLGMEKVVKDRLSDRLTDHVLSEATRRSGSGAPVEGIVGQVDAIIGEIVAKMFPGRTEKWKVSLINELNILETNVMLTALQRTGGDAHKAAELLNMSFRSMEYFVASKCGGDGRSAPMPTEIIEPQDREMARAKRERELIETALALEASITFAAKLLGITGRSLKYRAEKLGIDISKHEGLGKKD